MDAGFAETTSVDASETLDHALPFDKVADHVVGIDIDADFTGRCGEEKCWTFGIDSRIRAEPMRRKPSRSLLALANAAGTYEQLDVDWFFMIESDLLQSSGRVHRVFSAVAKNEDSAR